VFDVIIVFVVSEIFISAFAPVKVVTLVATPPTVLPSGYN